MAVLEVARSKKIRDPWWRSYWDAIFFFPHLCQTDEMLACENEGKKEW